MTLNHRITLQRPASGEDALGQPVVGWVDVAPLWADVRHLSGAQAIKADAALSKVRASIRVRVRGDLAAGMRVVHTAAGRTTTYEVQAVLRPSADMVDLVCEAVS
ncbi:phage head closure protein [Roseateles sp. BYS96W]|uniref:Phage head closure protein n=1 Tax=Pelomonas nitida TaxID=3299027 RepID=A0ABW7G7D4_9BURK